MFKRQRKAPRSVTVEHAPDEASSAPALPEPEPAVAPEPAAEPEVAAAVAEVVAAAEQATTLLRLKGWRGGLLLHLDADAPWDDVLAALHDKLDAVRDFWAGATCTLDLGTRAACPDGLGALPAQLEERYGLTVVAIAAARDEVREAIGAAGLEALAELEPAVLRAEPEVPPPPAPKYVKGTVRSGQVLEADGHLIIMGDVNAGAELRAGGDIMVFGTLRGMAHAGASGDRGAVIVALNLRPTQLRIADLIARAPDGGQPPLSKHPERAEVRGQEIHILSM
ncbi:MAG: septum site-determining protein MinC [Candidatus Sericytochromatia bacterium]|nr:septum site-determining protein MinC [Candidatus Sericytochromatia bacterium]